MCGSAEGGRGAKGGFHEWWQKRLPWLVKRLECNFWRVHAGGPAGRTEPAATLIAGRMEGAAPSSSTASLAEPL